ncbi:MAG: basic secretory protein-like protein, partial [Fimbriimonadaceae bacterium]
APAPPTTAPPIRNKHSRRLSFKLGLPSYFYVRKLYWDMVIAVSLALIQAQLSNHIYPLSKPIACPTVVTDSTDYPEGDAWLKAAKGLVEDYFPIVSTWLATEDFKPPKTITLIVKKGIGPPAYATGDTITVKAEWISQHPEDLGMIIHEMTHVLQQYPGSSNKPGWLVEGIADYIRWWRYEPELHATKGRTKPDPAKAKYTDSYRTTAVWLAWCSRTYNMGLVPALDRAMRKREDPMPVFEKLTGKSPDTLWKEYVESL